jgi:large subunit ribosomal protein L29
MERKEIINLNKIELIDKLTALQKQLMDLNFQRKTSHVEKPHLFKSVRKDIALILTVLREKENG